MDEQIQKDQIEQIDEIVPEKQDQKKDPKIQELGEKIQSVINTNKQLNQKILEQQNLISKITNKIKFEKIAIAEGINPKYVDLLSLDVNLNSENLVQIIKEKKEIYPDMFIAKVPNGVNIDNSTSPLKNEVTTISRDDRASFFKYIDDIAKGKIEVV
jgi:hypothetical protein